MPESLRNPNWSRDELIILLDFYLHNRPKIPSKTSAEISTLSNRLKQLSDKLGGHERGTFRNTNGVYMKLMNFRRFDPDYPGTGLTRGNKDEEVVWNLYAEKPQELSKVACGIKSFVEVDAPLGEAVSNAVDDEGDTQEGAILTRVHKSRERNRMIVQRKKAQVAKEHGHLRCAICLFDFGDRYGSYGEGFIECHHTKPVSSLVPGEKTKLSDLALVCSNCHRMLHRRRPWLTVDELTQVFVQQLSAKQ